MESETVTQDEEGSSAPFWVLMNLKKTGECCARARSASKPTGRYIFFFLNPTSTDRQCE
jgi:hypothetical protein